MAKICWGEIVLLFGAKVRIRALEKTDIENIMSWVNNHEVTRYLLAFSVPISRSSEEQWLERAVIHRESDKLFAIETLEGEYLGNCGLHLIDSIHRHAELGIAIGKATHLGRGYGTDAINVLLRMAFQSLNLHKVYLRVFSENKRGIRCYEKCGFKTVGRMAQHRFIEGQWNDELIMEILRSEWGGGRE